MTSTPTPSNVRLTISVSPEVHATFQRMAKAGNMSISKAMGEWLGDTIDAAEFMALKMEQARAAPKLVMAEMHAYALGLADETGDFIQKMKDMGKEDRRRVGMARAAQPGADLVPPSSNTGGKGTLDTVNKTSTNGLSGNNQKRK
jgi:hypothetical protein